MSAERDGGATPPFLDGLVKISFAVQDVLTRAATEHDLSVTQLRLLGILRDHTPAMAAIAHHLGLDPSSVSGLVDRAERRGLVARSTAAHDARVTTVSVTAAGRDLSGRLAGVIMARLEELVGHTTPVDRATIVRLAESMPMAR